MATVSFYSIPPLITAVLFAILGIYVYLKSRGSPENRAYALWCLSTVYWQFCWMILFSVHDPPTAALLIKVGYSGIIFIPITFYHFVISFLNLSRTPVRISYSVGVGFAISVWCDSFFINGLYSHPWGFYPKAGFLHPLYLLFLTILVCHGVLLLIKAIATEGPTANRFNQIKWVIWATLSYTLASVDFVVNYGANFYPFGFSFTLVSFSLVAYAITKHRLMDISVIVRKTLIYSVVTGTLTVIYLGTIALFARLFQGFAGYNTIFSSAIAAGLSVCKVL